MQRLVIKTIDEFCRATASDSFYPGGGCVSALAGALSGSLGQMVLALTIGKKKYAEHEPVLKTVLPEMEKAATELLLCVERDAEGCEGLLAAMGLPKDTDEQKAKRKQAMAEATRRANDAPLAVVGHAMQLLRLFAAHVGKVNQNAITDWAVGTHQAFAALEGAAYNVMINVGGVGDPEYAATTRTHIEAQVAEGRRLFEQVREQVWRQLLG